ncbi:DNA-directed RNA polymerase sigma-70 factor [Chitinophaga cymbidii]|uniref:DNA-directed RNA polymerase sigma-70 factor n=2 Tax=Chitinophaga cymbidii TaxID=1096750 RepID=A0A512RFE5_9BACT|nr:DNA-directed RNA polymerase sigma-70 factor [Chitinophaga cymbidii]
MVSLYKSMYQYLLNIGGRYTEDQHQVKDLIQQLFLHLWEQHARLPAVTHVKAYVARAFRNRLLNALKHAPRYVPVGEEEAAYEPAELSYFEKLLGYQENEARRARLSAALAQLTPRQLELLEMRFYLQMNYEEMESALGISRKTVYNIIFNALETLRREMK